MDCPVCGHPANVDSWHDNATFECLCCHQVLRLEAEELGDAIRNYLVVVLSDEEVLP